MSSQLPQLFTSRLLLRALQTAQDFINRMQEKICSGSLPNLGTHRRVRGELIAMVREDWEARL